MLGTSGKRTKVTCDVIWQVTVARNVYDGSLLGMPIRWNARPFDAGRARSEETARLEIRNSAYVTVCENTGTHRQ